MSSWLHVLPTTDRREWGSYPAPALPPGVRPLDQLAYFTGLDLGQSQDFTALAVVERTTQPDPAREGRAVFHFAVRHLHRWPLGTPYPAIVSGVKEMFAGAPLKGTPLVVDQTGVGRAVVDLFRIAGITAALRPYTITGGEAGGGGSVAKKNLVGSVQVPLQARRLRIAGSLPLAETLARELEMFRVKVTAARNEQFEAWRERDHDDLVLALALALYVGALTGGGMSLNGQRV